MEAKELMIGDWVNHKDQGFLRVVSLSADDYYIGVGQYMDCIGDGEYENRTYIHERYDQIDPIPLTPDIIKANGLEMGKNVFKNKVGPFEDDTIIDIRHSLIMIDDAERKEFWCVHLRNKECDCFEGGVISMNLNLLYVHQFQQALRVVGLTEWADNFKVE